MKNNKKKIGLIAVLAIVLVALILGYTYSKYATTVQRGTSTKVAGWSFTGELSNGADITSSSETTISLLDTASSTAGKLAPGTSGSFDIIIDADGSEVDIDYEVELTAESSRTPVNMYFTYNGTKYSTLEELFTNEDFSGTISKDSNSQEVNYTIDWEWPYETTGGDEDDTKDGQEISDYEFTVQITGTQALAN